MPTVMFDFISASKGVDAVVEYITDCRKAVLVQLDNLPTNLDVAKHALIDSIARVHGNAKPFIHAKVSWDLTEAQPTPSEASDYLREVFLRLGQRLGAPDFEQQPQIYAAHGDADHRHAHGLIDRVDDEGRVFFSERIADEVVQINAELADERGFRAPGWRPEVRPARLVNAEAWNGRRTFAWWLRDQLRRAGVRVASATPAEIDAALAGKGVQREFISGGLRFIYNGARTYRAKASDVGIPSSLTRNRALWPPPPPLTQTGDTYDRFLRSDESLTDFARAHPRRAEYERAVARGERVGALGKYLRREPPRATTTIEDPTTLTPPPDTTKPSLRIAAGEHRIELLDKALLGAEFFPELFGTDDTVLDMHARVEFDSERSAWVLTPVGPTELDGRDLQPLTSLALTPGDHRLRLGRTMLTVTEMQRSRAAQEQEMAERKPLHVVGPKGTHVVQDELLIGTETMPEMHGSGAAKRHARIAFDTNVNSWRVDALELPIKIGKDGTVLEAGASALLNPDEAVPLVIGSTRFSIAPQSRDLQEDAFAQAAAERGLSYDGSREYLETALDFVLAKYRAPQFIPLVVDASNVDLYHVEEQARVRVQRSAFDGDLEVGKPFVLKYARGENHRFTANAVGLDEKQIVDQSIDHVTQQRAFPPFRLSLNGRVATLREEQGSIGSRGFAESLFDDTRGVQPDHVGLSFDHEKNSWRVTNFSDSDPLVFNGVKLQRYEDGLLNAGETAELRIGDRVLTATIGDRAQKRVTEETQSQDGQAASSVEHNAIGGDERFEQSNAPRGPVASMQGLQGILTAYRAELVDRGFTAERTDAIINAMQEVLSARQRVQMEFAAMNDSFGLDRGTMLAAFQRLSYANLFSGVTVGLAEVARGAQVPQIEHVVSPQRVGMDPATYTMALARGMTAEAAGVAPRFAPPLHLANLSVAQQDAQYDPQLDNAGRPIVNPRNQQVEMRTETVWRYRWNDAQPKAYVDERSDGRYYVGKMNEIADTKALDTALMLAAARYNGRITLRGERAFVNAAIQRAAELGIVVTNRDLQNDYLKAVKRVTDAQQQELREPIQQTQEAPQIESHIERVLEGQVSGITRSQDNSHGDRWYNLIDIRQASAEQSNLVLMRSADADRSLTVGLLDLPDEMMNNAPTRGDNIRLAGRVRGKDLTVTDLQRRKDSRQQEQDRDRSRSNDQQQERSKRRRRQQQADR